MPSNTQHLLALLQHFVRRGSGCTVHLAAVPANEASVAAALVAVAAAAAAAAAAAITHESQVNAM